MLEMVVVFMYIYIYRIHRIDEIYFHHDSSIQISIQINCCYYFDYYLDYNCCY